MLYTTITYQNIQSYRTIAESIDIALSVGGEQGLLLLQNELDPWSTAIDEINAGLRTCYDLIYSGRRHEAIDWHYEGFLEMADRLNPDRPGWAYWNEKLIDQGLPIPPDIDQGLKGIVDAVFDELQVMNLEGQTLEQNIGLLRKNVISYGNLGERLILLRNIQTMDPSKSIWTEMIKSISKVRSDQILQDAHNSIKRSDHDSLLLLREEALGQVWNPPLPNQTLELLKAAIVWQRVIKNYEQLSVLARSLFIAFQKGEQETFGSSSYLVLVKNAMQKRAEYETCANLFEKDINDLQQQPLILKSITQLGKIDPFPELEVQLKKPLEWLGIQDQYEKLRLSFVAQEVKCNELMSVSPATMSASDDAKKWLDYAYRWLVMAEDRLLKCQNLCDQLKNNAPPGILNAMRKLKIKQQEVTNKIESVKFWFRTMIFGVVGGISLLFLLFILMLVFGKE